MEDRSLTVAALKRRRLRTKQQDFDARLQKSLNEYERLVDYCRNTPRMALIERNLIRRRPGR